MKGNFGQHGDNFIGMIVKKGKKLYKVVGQHDGVPYDEHFTIKDIETGKEITCGRDKFTIPRK